MQPRAGGISGGVKQLCCSCAPSYRIVVCRIPLSTLRHHWNWCAMWVETRDAFCRLQQCFSASLCLTCVYPMYAITYFLSSHHIWLQSNEADKSFGFYCFKSSIDRHDNFLDALAKCSAIAVFASAAVECRALCSIYPTVSATAMALAKH